MLNYAPKDKDSTEWFEVDWLVDLVPPWKGAKRYSPGQYVIPTDMLGFLYVADGIGGISSKHEPTQWPTVEDATVEDGSIVWRAVHPTFATIPQILSFDFVLPASMTEVSRAKGETTTRIQLTGGSNGVTEEVVASVTVDDPPGNVYERTLLIPIAEQ